MYNTIQKIDEQNKIYKGKINGIKDKEGRITENEILRAF